MLWRLFKKLPKAEILTLVAVACLCVVFRYAGISCLIYTFTHIPCPTCYMGRALTALAHGDFSLYTAYNIMAFPVAVVLVCELFGRQFGKFRPVLHIGSVCILSVNLVYYILRLTQRIPFALA